MLETICNRCLKKSVDERYATVAQLAADLRRFLRRDWWRVGAVAAGIISAAVVAGLASGALDSSRWSGGRERRGSGGSVNAGSRQGLAKGRAIASQTAWQPILDRRSTEVVWRRTGHNEYFPDVDRQRVTMVHESGRGLLSYGNLSSSNFSVQFVASIDRGGCGFFWALHQDREAFPEKNYRCMALMIRKVDDDGQLVLRLEEVGLITSPFDNSRLSVRSTKEIASASLETAKATELGIQFTVSRGELTELQVDEQERTLSWAFTNPAWSSFVPARYGFFVFNGDVTIENASIFTKE